jgi:hypothetical protein
VPLACGDKHYCHVTSGDAVIVPATLAFALVACQPLLSGCREFAAYAPLAA